MDLRTWIFENGAGALAYRLLTEQALWRRQIAALLDHFEAWDADPPRVLDLGCGPGVSTFVLAEELGPAAAVTGVDISAVMIERARRLAAQRYPEHRELSFLRADALDLPFPDASFEVVTGHSFLYIIGDRERALREIARVLVPGGRLVLMEPARSGSLVSAAFSTLPRLGEHLRRPQATARFAASMVLWRVFSSIAGRMTPATIDTLFTGAGLEVLAMSPTLHHLGWHCVGRRTPDR